MGISTSDCTRKLFKLEIDRYGFFGVNIDISAIHGQIADTNTPNIFKSCFLLHYQKYNVFYALLFYKNFKNQDLRAENFQTREISTFCYI